MNVQECIWVKISEHEHARVYMEYTSVYNAHFSIYHAVYILCSLLHTLVHILISTHDSCILVFTHYTSFKLCSYIMILSWLLLYSWTLSCVYSYGYVFITNYYNIIFTPVHFVLFYIQYVHSYIQGYLCTPILPIIIYMIISIHSTGAVHQYSVRYICTSVYIQYVH